MATRSTFDEKSSLTTLLQRLQGLAARMKIVQFPLHDKDISIVGYIAKDIQQLRSNPISPIHQVLAALRFYATGSFYSMQGDLHDVSVPSVCTILHPVSGALAKTLNENKTFPVTAREITQAKHDFFVRAGFPGVVGAVDYYRLAGLSIGDTGYALRPWLITPYLDPHTRGERRYNASLKRTRVIVEQMFGQLKRRFFCLVIGLRISPRRASTVILACAVLHLPSFSKSLSF